MVLGRLIIYFPFGYWLIFRGYLSFREGTRRPPPSNVIYLKVRHPPCLPGIPSPPPQKNVEELYSPRFNEWNLKMMGVLERIESIFRFHLSFPGYSEAPKWVEKYDASSRKHASGEWVSLVHFPLNHDYGRKGIISGSKLAGKSSHKYVSADSW